MAYKFQRLAARMSGSLTQEGNIAITTDTGVTVSIIDQYGLISGSSDLQAGGNLVVAGTVTLAGVSDTAIAVGSDALYFKDADGTMKSDTVADLMTAAAGAGLAASSGVLAVDIDELSALGSAGLHQTQDHFMFSDNGTEKKITFSNLQDAVFADVSGDATIAAGGALTIAANAVQTGMVHDDVATELAGDGLSASSGVMAVAVSGAIKVASDKLGLSGSLAGPGLTYDGGVDSISMLSLDIDGLSALGGTGVAQGDHFVFSDNGTEKKITASNLEDWIFGNVSGDATVAAGGALTIAADAVEPSMMNIFDDSLAATDTHFMIADGTDYSSFALSGDVTCTNAGVVTIANDAVETAMLNDNIISGQTELAHNDIADADEFMISDGGTLKRVGVDSLRDHYFGVVSGDATIADGGALTIAANAVQTGMVHDDVATELAGDGLSASSGVMAVAVSGAIKVASDKLGLSGSLAGPGLTYDGGVDSISMLSLDIDGLSALGGTGVAQGDHFVFSDSGTEKKITASNLEDWIFGNVSGDATIAAGGALTIAANAVQTGMVHDDVAAELAGAGLSAASGVMALDLNELTAETLASGDFLAFVDSTDNGTHKETVDDLATLFAGNGLSAASAVMALDLNELSAAAVDVANDSIAIVDANDSNASKKESIADLMTAVAGAGLTATNGVLAVDSAVAPVARGDANVTLSEGFNYGSTDLTSARTWTLPAPAEAGDIVHVKAPANCSTTLTITIDGGTIDGDSSIVLESPHAAVSLICFDQG